MQHGRRSFMVGALAQGLCLAAWGCNRERPATVEEVLRSLIVDVMVPEHRQLTERARALADAAQELERSGGSTLEATRRAHKDALIAWSRVYSFRDGPIVGSYALMRALYWPPRQGASAILLADAAAVDDAYAEKLGVDRRGMFTLERLLFSPELEPTLRASSETGTRARALVRALSKNAWSYAERARVELGDGSEFAEKYAATGRESLSRLVYQMVGSLETILVERFLLARQMVEAQRVKPEQLRGGLAGLSSELAQAEVFAIERLYRGVDKRGIADLVRAGAPKLEQSLSKHFALVRTALAALGSPIEQAVVSERGQFEVAVRELRALEIAIKTELTSALGLTLTFVAGDGD